MSQPTPEQREQFERVVGFLPTRIADPVRDLLDTWVARVVLGTAWGLQRIQIFDRAMAVAAQLFTSIFPTLILMASWIGSNSGLLHDMLGMPEVAEQDITNELKTGAGASFGVIGTIIVVASATSLSRALTRAFAAVWMLPKPKSNVASAWRWVAVVMAIALSLVALRRSQSIADSIPPRSFWARCWPSCSSSSSPPSSPGCCSRARSRCEPWPSGRCCSRSR